MGHAAMRAVARSRAEQGQRMRGMRRYLQQHDIHAWTSAFLAGLVSA